MSQTASSIFITKHGHRIRQATYGLLMATVVILAGFVWTGPILSLVQHVANTFTNTPAKTAGLISATTAEAGPVHATSALFTLRELGNHPDDLHGSYTSAPLVTLDDHPIREEHLEEFRDLLSVYVYRQAVDDNFTVRVFDRRTSGLLERYTLEDQKQQYAATGVADWAEIDVKRSQISSRLIGKYRRRGVPLEDIMVKWGRLDQVRLAREREASFIEYEIRLSQTLGLSLLSTELGTVETFNDDKLISTVGARGRYQMMPYLLRRFGINTYSLWTPAGESVEVHEEWHPLLTMETAFTIVKGYTNAIGHEIPGISAYHTGPFNIFRILNLYLEHEQAMFSPTDTVMDAYLWAMTEGFEEVADVSGFRHYSRSYIPSAYGSLRGIENVPVDTSRTIRAERVQTHVGEKLYLSNLLETLDSAHVALDWGYASSAPTLYGRFRMLNPHIDLPANETEDFVPRAGDVYLTTRSSSRPVRFFLPIGATELLEASGMNILDADKTFRFDQETFSIPAEGPTVWDQQYARLVDDIKYFGFTYDNRARLNILAERFEKLAESEPSQYRNLQLSIIKMHQNLWRTRFWSELAFNTAAATDRIEVAARPTAPIGLTQRLSFLPHSDAVEEDAELLPVVNLKAGHQAD